MTGVKFLTVITDRDYAVHFSEFFKAHGISRAFGTLAHGTAEGSVLDAFGLEKTEKVIFSLMVRTEDLPELKRGLVSEMKITSAGAGIAVITPVDGIGGATAKKCLVGEQPFEREKEDKMEQSEYVLINVVADRGNTDLVMEAARGAGATGGTAVRARGTGAGIAKILGMTISEEKEIIYIVAPRALRDGIMRAVMEKAGKDTSAHGIVFSLPVESVLGISGYEA